jgi:fructose-1,6-bisphosphatase
MSVTKRQRKEKVSYDGTDEIWNSFQQEISQFCNKTLVRRNSSQELIAAFVGEGNDNNNFSEF